MDKNPIDPEWLDLLRNPQESRSVEYLSSETWDHLKNKIVKTCLAMANTKNGGYIVMGFKKESLNGQLMATGMEPEHLQTWKMDEIKKYVNKYAEPSINLDIDFLEDKGKKFIIIRVHQFDNVPVLCKKPIQKEKIYKGDLLVRPYGTVESRRVQTAEEMRQVLNLAVSQKLMSLSDEALFEKQLEELLRDKVVAEIKEKAHWQIVLRPRKFKKARIRQLEELWKIIEKAQVRFFEPHLPYITNEKEYRLQGKDYIGCQIQTLSREYWRFYQSGQFIYLFTFLENNQDFVDYRYLYFKRLFRLTARNIAPNKLMIDILFDIFTFTKIFEFAKRLSQLEILYPQCKMIIGKYSPQGYPLSPGIFRHINTLEKSWVLKHDELIANSRNLSIEAIIWFFDRLGMEMPVEMISDIQEGFFHDMEMEKW